MISICNVAFIKKHNTSQANTFKLTLLDFYNKNVMLVCYLFMLLDIVYRLYQQYTIVWNYPHFAYNKGMNCKPNDMFRGSTMNLTVN